MCVLCTCVCVYACFSVSTYVRFCALCRWVCLCIRVYLWAYACVYVCTYMCMWVFVWALVHVFVRVCICVRVQHFSCPLSLRRKVLTVGLPLSTAQHLVSIPSDVVNFGAPAPQPGENCHFLETKSCDASGYGIGSLPKTITGWKCWGRLEGFLILIFPWIHDVSCN